MIFDKIKGKLIRSHLVTVGLNEQEVLKNVSGVLLTVPIGDYENPFNALNGKIFGWEIFAQFKFVAKIRSKGGKIPPKS